MVEKWEELKLALIINRNTTYRIPKNPASPIRHAWEMVKRDHEQVLGAVPRLISAEDEPADVVIRYAVPEDRCPDRPEAFCFRFVKYGGRTELHIAAGDDLGLVYGMLEYSGKTSASIRSGSGRTCLPSGEAASSFRRAITIRRNRSSGSVAGSSTTRYA